MGKAAILRLEDYQDNGTPEDKLWHLVLAPAVQIYSICADMLALAELKQRPHLLHKVREIQRAAQNIREQNRLIRDAGYLEASDVRIQDLCEAAWDVATDLMRTPYHNYSVDIQGRIMAIENAVARRKRYYREETKRAT